MRGHSVLQVPVPALEAFVRERHAFYDAAWVSTDPTFGHAHITALGPFLDDADLGLDDAVAATIAAIAAATPAFDVVLDRIDTMPDGLIHLVPEPAAPFADLTARLFAAFPQCPPYRDEYPGVRPHLTLDLTSPTVSVASTRALLGDLLPARARAERLDLAWWEADGCRTLRSWPLGG